MKKKPIKVCHISEATSGGVFTHLKQLATEMDPDIVDQTFILSAKRNERLRNYKDFYGNKLYLVDMEREISPFKDVFSFLQITSLLLKERFDIIHCHSSKAGVLGRLASFLTGKSATIYTPHAFSFHSYLSTGKNEFYIAIERVMSLFTTRLICVSEGEKRQAENAKIISSEKLIVIKNGVKTINCIPTLSKQDWLKQQGFTGNEKIIGFVGRLTKQKNPKHLLLAFRELIASDDTPDPNCVILIIGDGEQLSDLQTLSKMLGIEERVIFLREVDNASELMSYFNVFVSCSLWEGMPYAILEAIVSKVPVIATRISGVTEIIHHEKTGLLVMPDNIQELSMAIKRVLSDEAAFKKVAEEALMLIINNHSISRMIKELQSLYQTVQAQIKGVNQ